MKYLVTGSEGPGFTSPEQAVEVLERGILPTFDALMKLEADKKILAGGLPVGDRALVFILEAASHEEVDQLLRDLPAWGVLKWTVTPLQSFEGRAKKERSVVEEIKKQIV
jgi:muconolactone delta-isomerase